MENKKYEFKKLVFRIAFVIMGIYTIMVGVVYGIENYYYISCDENEVQSCKNPIVHCRDIKNSFAYFQYECEHYEELIDKCRETPLSDLCNKSEIEPGTYIGDFPPYFITHAYFFFLGILVLAFGVNHLVYNRGKKNVHNN